MDFICAKCNGSISTRVKSQRWITLKCRCEITIIYFDGCIKTKTKEQYLNWKKEKNMQVENDDI